MKNMLDLCSGLGGASEAFALDPKWEVLRVDNNPAFEDVPHTLIEDIFENNFDGGAEWFKPWSLIWASPTCTEFSTAKTWAQGRTADPCLKLTKRCMELIQYHKPKWWVIENVIGAIPHFRPFLGDPIAIHGPFVLWGNIPALHLHGFKHSKAEHDTWSSDPLRANKKAKVPLQISSALLTAISEQTFLEDWI